MRPLLFGFRVLCALRCVYGGFHFLLLSYTSPGFFSVALLFPCRVYFFSKHHMFPGFDPLGEPLEVMLIGVFAFFSVAPAGCRLTCVFFVSLEWNWLRDVGCFDPALSQFFRTLYPDVLPWPSFVPDFLVLLIWLLTSTFRVVCRGWLR